MKVRLVLLDQAFQAGHLIILTRPRKLMELLQFQDSHDPLEITHASWELEKLPQLQVENAVS